MAMTKMELDKKEGEANSVEAQENEKPKYPFGLEIRLDKEALKKLKLYGKVEMDEKFELKAMVHVCAMSTYETQEDENANICLQITEMELEPYTESAMSRIGKKVYKD